MNYSLFKSILHAEAITCYNNFIYSYDHNPFNNAEHILNDVIEFEINQSLGKKALSAIISNTLSITQFQLINKTIKHYKNRTINAAIKYAFK